MNHRLDQVNILLADQDDQIARIIILNLRDMGFRKIHHVRNATDVISHLRIYPVDILISEWLLAPIDGVGLVRYLRLSENSPNRGLPIIMLTGKGEYQDVVTARDVGITEFLVKPFTVQALFERIEHLVDHPRPMILSENFVGPDRRRRAADAPDERRSVRPKESQKYGKHLPAPDKTPLVFAPDYEIRKAIGLTGALSNLITSDILQTAQKNLDAMQDETLVWLRADLDALEKSFREIQVEPSGIQLAMMKEVAMSIKARAGTFGFKIPSQIARMLFLFLNTDYVLGHTMHNQVLKKFIESLKVIFAADAKGQGGIANELVMELEELVKRTAAR